MKLGNVCLEVDLRLKRVHKLDVGTAILFAQKVPFSEVILKKTVLSTKAGVEKNSSIKGCKRPLVKHFLNIRYQLKLWYSRYCAKTGDEHVVLIRTAAS